MKKTNLLISAIILILILILSSTTVIATSSTANINVNILKYEPIPAQPGQYVTVYLEIENNGNEDATNAALEIENQFPFSTLTPNDNHMSFGKLKSQESKVETIKLKVSSDAIVGTNQLKVRYTDDEKNNNWIERKLNIEVKTNQASLTIEQVKNNPEEIKAGEEENIQIKIKNNENIVLRDIGIKLNMITTVGTKNIDLPFIPTNSSTEKKITKLNPGEIATLDFNIKSYPSATPGYYKIPITINYFDEQGSETTKNDLIGMIISSQPELEVYVDSTTITKETNQGELTLKFINKGINDLKFLDVKIIDDKTYEILSNKNNYIGDLDSDDYRSETFTIKTMKENTNLKLDINFKDENNKGYIQTIEIPIEYNKITNTKKNNSSTIIIVLLVIIIGAIIFWKRKKQKR